MTNYGFHTAMAEAGIEVATTAVGDRYVLDELRRRGWALGGEQSGHIIDLGFGPSGDGIASALLTLEALGRRPSARARRDAEAPAAAGQHPRARPRGARRRDGAAAGAVEAIGREADGARPAAAGCWCARPGTEPLIRVMVEAPSRAETDAVCDRLSDVVKAVLAGE